MPNQNRWLPGIAVYANFEGASGIWLIRRINGTNVTLANIDSQVVLVKSEEELEKCLEEQNLQFMAEEHFNGEIVFQDMPEEYQEQITRKYAYVKAYIASNDQKRSKRKLEKLIGLVSGSIEDENPPAWNTLNSWLNQYQSSGGRIRGLYPSHYKKGSRTQKLDPQVYEIMNQSIKLFFKNRQMLMSSIYSVMEAKILKHNLSNPDSLLTAPAYSTLVYHIKKRSYQEHILGRVGKKRARYEFSNVGEAPRTSRILERVEADHTPLDINVLHDETKTLLGRPTLTVLIDHYSRMILGIQISFEAPSYASAAMAIRNAILPKNDLLEFYNVDGNWPAYGVMEMMVADNGTEFWSENLDMAISEVGAVLQYAPVRSPNYKGVVERFFLTLKTMLIDLLPGKTNGVGNGSDEYIAEKEAKLTLSEFKKIFLTWLVNIYHLEPHGKSEKSPLDLWVDSSRAFPVVEEDVKRIETALMCSDRRTLQRSGIQYESLEYNSEHLRDIYRREGVVELLIKYSPFDIGHIYVWDDLNRIYIKVLCVNYEYASGLSMYAHKVIRKRINSSKKSYKENAVLQKAKIELFGDIESLHERNVRRKSQVTTKKAARSNLLGVEDFSAQTNIEDDNRVVTQNMISDEESDDWEVW
jgi:putative transposase